MNITYFLYRSTLWLSNLSVSIYVQMETLWKNTLTKLWHQMIKQVQALFKNDIEYIRKHYKYIKQCVNS